MPKKITKQNDENFIIEETKTQEIKTTQYINIPNLEKDIAFLESKIDGLKNELSEKKSLLKEVKK